MLGMMGGTLDFTQLWAQELGAPRTITYISGSKSTWRRLTVLQQLPLREELTQISGWRHTSYITATTGTAGSPSLLPTAPKSKFVFVKVCCERDVCILVIWSSCSMATATGIQLWKTDFKPQSWQSTCASILDPGTITSVWGPKSMAAQNHQQLDGRFQEHVGDFLGMVSARELLF